MDIGDKTPRVAEALIVLSVLAAYLALAAGLFGLMPARTVSLIALVGAGIGACSLLGYVILSRHGLRRGRYWA